eukprot:5976602-Alexandrium_andersonii.AAC.1
MPGLRPARSCRKEMGGSGGIVGCTSLAGGRRCTCLCGGAGAGAIGGLRVAGVGAKYPRRG